MGGTAITRVVRYILKGDKGDTGSNGRIPIPYGEYDATKYYTATDIVAPYVLVGKEYYIMIRTTTWYGYGKPGPAYDAATNPDPTWMKMEYFKAIYTEIFMANLGKIASAIFYGDLMFSQQGTINGSASTEYDKIAIYSSGKINESAGNFIPNLWMNFLTGELHAKRGEFGGHIRTGFETIDQDTTLYVSLDGSVYKYRVQDNWSLKFNLSENQELQLPSDPGYAGARILVISPVPIVTKTNPPAHRVTTQSNRAIIGNYNSDGNAQATMDLYGRSAEFIGYPFGNITEWALLWSNDAIEKV